MLDWRLQLDWRLDARLETGHWTRDWALDWRRGLALYIQVATSIVCRYAIVQDVHCTDILCKLRNGLSSGLYMYCMKPKTRVCKRFTFTKT